MSYCTIDDLQAEVNVNELLMAVNDENADLDDIDLTDTDDARTIRLNEMISAADAEIDGYMRSRYQLPLTTVPELIKQISKDISLFNIHKRRHRADISESYLELYDRRIKQLNGIKTGAIDLGIEVAGESERYDEVQTNKTSDDRIFTSDLLDGYL